MSTIIRHKQVNSTTIDIVVTEYDTTEGFTARYQRYYVRDNGSTVLENTQAFSTEHAAITYFNRERT